MKPLAAVTIILAALFAFAACGGDDNNTGSSSTSAPSGFSAISSAAVKSLQDRVQADLVKYKWAAGCAWDIKSRGKGTQLTPVELLGFDASKQWASGTIGTVGSGEGQPFATIYDPAFSGTAGATLERVDGSGFVCFKPKA